MSGVTALVVARMGSIRLPRKSMMSLLGNPMVERLIERVLAASAVERVVLATTELPGDDPLEELADSLGIKCFRGASEDVLARLHGAAVASCGDPLLQILGDNPLVPSELIDDVVRFHQDQDLDYAVSATTEFPGLGHEVSKFPIGVRVEVIRASALMRCHREARTPDEREHSLSYVYTHPEDFRVGHFPAEGSWAGVARPELTFAVNYGTNLELVSRIFELCHPTDPNFPLSAAVEAFDAHPELHPLMGAPVEA